MPDGNRKNISLLQCVTNFNKICTQKPSGMFCVDSCVYTCTSKDWSLLLMVLQTTSCPAKEHRA